MRSHLWRFTAGVGVVLFITAFVLCQFCKRNGLSGSDLHVVGVLMYLGAAISLFCAAAQRALAPALLLTLAWSGCSSGSRVAPDAERPDPPLAAAAAECVTRADLEAALAAVLPPPPPPANCAECEATVQALAARIEELEHAVDLPPTEADYLASLRKLIESGEITTPAELQARVDAMVKAGWLSSADVAADLTALLPAGESPFPSDRVRVLIVFEQTAPEPESVSRARVWMIDHLPKGDWAIRDDDLRPADLSDESQWVQAAYAAALTSGRADDQPWFVVGAPDHGFSGPVTTLEDLVNQTWLECN